MKISLIHPSRGRAVKAKQTITSWMARRSPNSTHIIEHIVSVDKDDPQLFQYLDVFTKACVNSTSDVVSATNRAAQISTGDVLVYLSDDFSCPEGWDDDIETQFHGIESAPMLIKVDDCLQKFDVAVLTIPIMNRALYRKLGYFWHPQYKSMFVDEDLYWTCRNRRWMRLAPGLKFPHHHPCNGKAPNDETYRRSAANWEQGKAVFAARKAKNFPLTIA